jgi:hypothetical protein
MRFADLEIDDVIEALKKERAEWISVAKHESRVNTEAERVTICLLLAIERVLSTAAIRPDVGSA